MSIKRRPRKWGVKAGEDWVVKEGIAEGVAEGLVVVEEGLVTEEGAAMAGEEGAEPAADYAMLTTVPTTPATREKDY